MTVQEWFEGDKIMREDLVAMSEESDYCEKAAGFVLDKWDTEADDLTMNQSAWAGKILEDMVERRITKSQRRRY